MKVTNIYWCAESGILDSDSPSWWWSAGFPEMDRQSGKSGTPFIL